MLIPVHGQSRSIFVICALLTCLGSAGRRGIIARTPPMGWMSWQAFRCSTNCAKRPTHCVNDELYVEMGKRLAGEGYLKAGYSFVSIDDCWAEKRGSGRDFDSGKILPDPVRFPHGLEYVSRSLRRLNVTFGLYYDIGELTCAKYPGSAGHFDTDVRALVDWGVGYIKVDGCNVHNDSYERDYTHFGDELRAMSNIVYSCSWPAYIHTKDELESRKPYQQMVAAHCNLWRNWHDIQCNWNSLRSIIDHFGDNSKFLASVGGPGHWNDMDMLLVGEDCITHDEARIQMAIWAIMASPLIMGNDLRTVDDINKGILLNKEAIAISQDPLGKPGYRITPKSDIEIWFRQLQDGQMAVTLLNKGLAAEKLLRFRDLPLFDVGKNRSVSLQCNVRDIFQKKNLGLIVEQLFSALAPRSCLFLRLDCSVVSIAIEETL